MNYFKNAKFFRCMALALLALTCFVGSNSVNAADGYAQKREMRSVWIATVFNIDWPKANHYGNPDLMKADLIAYFDACKTANLNSVCFQVRPMCDAFYKSSYEPWSSYLSGSRGTDPGWDPLAFAVQEAHKRGLRIDAWVNPYRYSKTPEQPWAGESWSNAKDAEARKHLLTYGGVSILDPAQKWTIDRIVNVCVEIITKYDVDGLVFDDYFYPDKIPTTNTAGDYKEWQNSGTSMNIGDWRRDNVNRMVKAVYAAVQQHRPDCSFGISPAGVSCSDAAVAKKHGVEQITCASDWQYNGIFSDPVQWLEDKSIDYISPQIYWSTTNKQAPYIPLTQWWSKVANQFGRHHYASHYNTSESVLTPGNTASYIQMLYQISANRSNTLNNAPGSIFFSAKCLKDGVWGNTFANYVKQNIYTHKAIPPAMTWKAKANYKKPENLAKNGKQLSWDAVSNDKMCRYAIYAVPKSTSMPYASTAQNGINSEHLVDVTYTNSYELPADKADNYWYAVTALDAANNEYEAATLGEPVFTGTKLELNTTDLNHRNQMSASYNETSGEYTLNTTGNDPYIFTKALASDLASSLCVVEFDYTSSADINNLQIFFGNTWSEARSKFFGTMNATSSFKSFQAIIANERNSLSWGKKGEKLRLDFGSQSGITIKVKNLRVREMTAAEKENYEYKEDATGDLAGLGYFFKKGENGLWYFHSADNGIAYGNRDFVVLKSFDSNYTKYEGIKDNYFIEWILKKSGSRVWYTRARNSVNAKLPFWPSIINGKFPDGYPGGATSFNDVFDISTGFKAVTNAYPFKLVLLPVAKAENDFSPKGLNEFTEINLGTYGVETKTSEVSDGHPLYTFSGVSDITGIGYYTDIKKLNMSRERFGFNAKGTSYSVDADNRQFNSYTPISSADLSHNKKLEEVYLDFNNLTTFDASVLPNLKVLNLSNNMKLKSLDITKNTQLAELRLEHDFDFTHLKADKTANAAMKSLLIFDNVYGYDEENNGLPNNTFQTEVIDQLPNLEVLHAFSMYIDKIDLSGLKNLKSLWLHKSRWAGRQLAKGNWLHKLDLSQNLELRDVHVQNMHLNALTINSPHIGEDYGYPQEPEIKGDPNLPGIDASNNYRKVKADLAKFSHKGKHFYIYYLRTQWTGAEGGEPMLSKKKGEYIIHHYETYLGNNNKENKPCETSVTLTHAETLEADGLDVSKVSNWRIAKPINADDIKTKGVIIHSVEDGATKLPVINSNMTSTSQITNFDYIKDWFNNVANFKFSDARGEFVVLKAYVSDTKPLTGAPIGAPDNICYDYDLRGDALNGVTLAHPEKYKATFFLDIEYPELGGLATDVLENELGDKPVQCVTYTDIAGRVSTRPFNGLNIVVTHYTDGTSKVIKKIYR